jgi:hypothetical protein
MTKLVTVLRHSKRYVGIVVIESSLFCVTVGLTSIRKPPSNLLHSSPVAVAT